MRYITANASGRVPFETQLILWGLFDRMNPSYRDYLQIFNLSRQDGKQMIRHHQEKPPWSESVVCITGEAITEKVYILTENGNDVMLLAEDY